mmetsp:Transcript_28118/g.82639  ORF Transcript_28118/g.82639 Transcript_28118/m.82639 type:complete len:89 (-) Transcript_28118:1068-1334(-)
MTCDAATDGGTLGQGSVHRHHVLLGEAILSQADDFETPLGSAVAALSRRIPEESTQPPKATMVHVAVENAISAHVECGEGLGQGDRVN